MESPPPSPGCGCDMLSTSAPAAMSPRTSLAVSAGFGRSWGMGSGRSVTPQHIGSRAGDEEPLFGHEVY